VRLMTALTGVLLGEGSWVAIGQFARPAGYQYDL
jgi:hypothetical protein